MTSPDTFLLLDTGKTQQERVHDLRRDFYTYRPTSAAATPVAAGDSQARALFIGGPRHARPDSDAEIDPLARSGTSSEDERMSPLEAGQGYGSGPGPGPDGGQHGRGIERFQPSPISPLSPTTRHVARKQIRRGPGELQFATPVFPDSHMAAYLRRRSEGAGAVRRPSVHSEGGLQQLSTRARRCRKRVSVPTEHARSSPLHSLHQTPRRESEPTMSESSVAGAEPTGGSNRGFAMQQYQDFLAECNLRRNPFWSEESRTGPD